MNDKDVLGHIDELIAEEHTLRAKSISTTGLSAEERDRLHEVEVRLDQCWDLLRQRRAKTEFGRNPDDARTRPASEVENYRN